MGCAASVEEEYPEAEIVTEANAPIARPRGGGRIPELPSGQEYGVFNVRVPAGQSINFGNWVAGEMIAVYSPDGQELEVPCPEGYEAEASEFPCRYVPSPDPNRPAPPYVGSGAGLNWVSKSSGGGGGGGGDGQKQRAPLRLCRGCSHGHKGMCCFKCGTHIPSHQRAIAPSCRDCSFGRNKDHCASCGEYPVVSNALLCYTCGMGPDGKDHCAKCGNYCGAFYG